MQHPGSAPLPTASWRPSAETLVFTTGSARIERNTALTLVVSQAVGMQLPTGGLRNHTAGYEATLGTVVPREAWEVSLSSGMADGPLVAVPAESVSPVGSWAGVAITFSAEDPETPTAINMSLTPRMDMVPGDTLVLRLSLFTSRGDAPAAVRTEPPGVFQEAAWAAGPRAFTMTFASAVSRGTPVLVLIPDVGVETPSEGVDASPDIEYFVDAMEGVVPLTVVPTQEFIPAVLAQSSLAYTADTGIGASGVWVNFTAAKAIPAGQAFTLVLPGFAGLSNPRFSTRALLPPDMTEPHRGTAFPQNASAAPEGGWVLGSYTTSLTGLPASNLTLSFVVRIPRGAAVSVLVPASVGISLPFQGLPADSPALTIEGPGLFSATRIRSTPAVPAVLEECGPAREPLPLPQQPPEPDSSRTKAATT